MRTLSLLVATTALLLMTAVPAQAQDVGIKNPNVSTPTTLYFHVINVQDMPINTQVPDPKFTDNGAFGPGTNTLKCLDGPTNNQAGGSTSQIYHSNYGYSSPSYVEYDYQNANGEPRTHPERGISYDAIFDQGAPFNVIWYVQTYVGAGLDAVPVPMPNMVVAATMRAGDAISVDDKAYDSGPLIAHGKTDPVILMTGSPPGQGPLNSQGQPHTQVSYEGNTDGGAAIYKFTIPMTFDADRVLRATGFNMRIDMYMDNPACADPSGEDKAYIMPQTVAPFSDAAHRPQMQLSVMNPIRLEYLHPQFVGDDLVVHTSMNSAWGNYDVGEVNPMTPIVDDSFIQVKIEGPSPAQSLAKAALVQRFHEHYHHQEAVDVTYVWPYKTDRASNGLYTVFVSFKNDQNTAEASGTAQFEIGKGTVIGCGGIQESSQSQSDDCAESIQVDGKTASKDAPGLPLAGALAAIAAIAVALRRRQA